MCRGGLLLASPMVPLMMTPDHRTNTAIQLALGSDLALGALGKLMPGLMPVVVDHTAQTLALLALAVGVTHVTEAVSSYIGRIKRLFSRKPQGKPADAAPAQPKPARETGRRNSSQKKRGAVADAEAKSPARRGSAVGRNKRRAAERIAPPRGRSLALVRET